MTIGQFHVVRGMMEALAEKEFCSDCDVILAEEEFLDKRRGLFVCNWDPVISVSKIILKKKYTTTTS